MRNQAPVTVTDPRYKTFTTMEIVQSLKTSIFPELHRLMLPQVVAAAEEVTGVAGEVVHHSKDDDRFVDGAYELMISDPARWNITGPSGSRWWTP